MPVDTAHPSYEALRKQWERLRDCFAGRDAVIARGSDYLPTLPGNPESDYNTRGSFYNAVRRTVQGLAGAITQKEPELDLPGKLEEIEDDLARPRQSIQAFVKGTLDEVLLMGRAGVLVDMAATVLPGAHPYLIMYRTEDIVSWRVEERQGTDKLTRVVLRERVSEPDPKDEFALVTVEQYRVLSLSPAPAAYTQTVWRKTGGAGKNDWEPWTPPGQSDATMTPMRLGKALDFIPFVFMGPTSESIEPEAPPLTDLADINLAHWRNSADYEYALHLVALPTPWCSGARSDDNTGAKKIGPSVVWELDQGGQAGFLEYSGQGVGSIREAMEAKEKQMASLGARLLEEQPKVNETAEAVRTRQAGEHATLRSITKSVGDGITRTLRIIEWWMSALATPEDATAEAALNQEFFQVRASAEEVKTLLLALQAGEISYETFYEGLQKGGWAREGVSAEDEKKQIERETPPAPEPPPVPPPPPPPSPPPPPAGGAA